MRINKIMQTVKAEPAKLEITGATLLSIEEYKKYRKNIPLLNDWWWLRSPGVFEDTAAYVDDDGSVNYTGIYVNNNNEAVRPALKIKNIESSSLQIGEKFIAGGYTFMIISNDYAIYDSSIAKHIFDKTENDYEKSEIKKYVDKWFEDNFNDRNKNVL